MEKSYLGAASGAAMLAGFQPTGDGRLHVGNFLGSALPFSRARAPAGKFAMVADVHALSLGRLPEGFARAKARMLRELEACGAREGGTMLFEQSRVPELLALSALLAPFAQIGELRRAGHYEEKLARCEGETLALLGYPCLMAADILGIGAMDVVVGEDQRQHLELARGVSARFLDRMGVDLGRPSAVELGLLGGPTRVKSLRDPVKKMSKSDESESGTIFLLDPRDAIAKKIRRATTDPKPLPERGEPLEEAARPGAANLLLLASACMGVTKEEALLKVAGMGHSALKEMAIEAVDAVLSPIRTSFESIGEAEALARAREDAERVRQIARARLALASAPLG